MSEERADVDANAVMDATKDIKRRIAGVGLAQRFVHALHRLNAFVPRTAFVKPTAAASLAQALQPSLTLH